MASREHLRILRQGVATWNAWRESNTDVQPDFYRSSFYMSDLRGAFLRRADFSNAFLSGANLAKADLSKANFSRADLHGVDFSQAVLDRTNFIGADLEGADLSNCTMEGCVFADVNLSTIKGLDSVRHFGPSEISISTIFRSSRETPTRFLYAAGVPEKLIGELQSFFAEVSLSSLSSCFISYSTKDEQFAERLHADLQNNGVRCWFAPENLKIGDKLRSSFDEAIRLHDKLMVLLSENSVKSSWVEKEVETAFERERKEKRTVLFPIRLDDAVMETQEAWAADIRRMRHIGDFRNWKDHDSYKRALERLLRDLREENKAVSAAQK
jgi:hypothetical protein